MLIFVKCVTVKLVILAFRKFFLQSKCFATFALKLIKIDQLQIQFRFKCFYRFRILKR